MRSPEIFGRSACSDISTKVLCGQETSMLVNREFVVNFVPVRLGVVGLFSAADRFRASGLSLGYASASRGTRQLPSAVYKSTVRTTSIAPSLRRWNELHPLTLIQTLISTSKPYAIIYHAEITSRLLRDGLPTLYHILLLPRNLHS